MQKLTKKAQSKKEAPVAVEEEESSGPSSDQVELLRVTNERLKAKIVEFIQVIDQINKEKAELQ